MNLPVVLSGEAEREFDEAANWFENERLGLGAEFTLAIDEALARIATNPQQHPRVLGDVRRAQVRRFRYVVLFTIETDHIAVLSIFHTRRDPRQWQRRL